MAVASGSSRARCASARRAARRLRCDAVATPAPSPAAPAAPAVPLLTVESRPLRLGIPSKGRMAELTLELLDDCQLTVRKVNDRQYVARMPNVSNLEVWFQRASDVMRKMRSGDIDLGIVGYDMFVELGAGDPDLVVVHDSLQFGHCHLAVAVPQGWDHVTSLDELAALPWSEARPMRVVTGYTHIAQQFFAKAGLRHVALSTADGALEAAPAMGSADVILDLVSSGTTLRENNLKQVAGGRVLESQGVLVASKRALLTRPGALEVVRDMVERLEAHLRAVGHFMVVANLRGASAADAAGRLAAAGPLLAGLQGPTIGNVYNTHAGVGGGDIVPPTKGEFFSASLCVPRARIYDAVKQLRAAGGSGVLVSPLTYIFDEETPRWRALLKELGVDPADVPK